MSVSECIILEAGDQWNAKYMKDEFIGTFVVEREDYYWLHNRWREKRKQPLFHVKQIIGYDLPKDGLSGVVYTSPSLSQHRKPDKAVNRVCELNANPTNKLRIRQSVGNCSVVMSIEAKKRTMRVIANRVSQQ